MTADVFEEWFGQDILPKLKENSIVVMDKADIQSWLTSKNLDFNELMLKANLLEIVKQEKHKYQRYGKK
jgi:hypothetical protein